MAREQEIFQGGTTKVTHLGQYHQLKLHPQIYIIKIEGEYAVCLFREREKCDHPSETRNAQAVVPFGLDADKKNT